MKIESKTLVEFLKIIRMNEVNDCLMNFNDEGLMISLASKTAYNFGNGTLKKEHFKDYIELGIVAVDNLDQLVTIFKKFKGEIDLRVKGNVMMISNDKKKLEFELMDENFIKPFIFDKQLKYDNIIKIPPDKLKTFFDDISINTDECIFIETVNDGFKLYNTGKYKFTYNIKSEGTKEGVKVQFKEPFYNTLIALTENEIEIKVKSDYPATVSYKTDTAEFEFIIAPRVEKD